MRWRLDTSTRAMLTEQDGRSRYHRASNQAGLLKNA